MLKYLSLFFFILLFTANSYASCPTISDWQPHVPDQEWVLQDRIRDEGWRVTYSNPHQEMSSVGSVVQAEMRFAFYWSHYIAYCNYYSNQTLVAILFNRITPDITQLRGFSKYNLPDDSYKPIYFCNSDINTTSNCEWQHLDTR